MKLHTVSPTLHKSKTRNSIETVITKHLHFAPNSTFKAYSWQM